MLLTRALLLASACLLVGATQDLTIQYGNVQVAQGNQLTPSQTSEPPSFVSWNTSPETLYTLLLIDPDVPASKRDILHWAITNIAGTNIATGETNGLYLAPAPPAGTGEHRYIFQLYTQKAKVNVARINTRTSFNVTRFVETNRLEGPIAQNYFVAQHQN